MKPAICILVVDLRDRVLHSPTNQAAVASAEAREATKTLKLYTSLPRKLQRTAAGNDFGASYQLACIELWQRAGFEIVSVNSAAEIEELSKTAYGVTFLEVSLSPPRISELLDAFERSGDELAGIINADCLLLAPDGLLVPMLDAARNGIVMSERMNLNPENLQVTGGSCCGFDFFLFGSKVLRTLRFDDEISMGTPWWDYWFPLAHERSGGKLFLVTAPTLVHLDHPTKWTEETWRLQAKRVHAAFAAGATNKPSLSFIEKERTDLSDDYLVSMAMGIFAWLKSRAKTIKPIGARAEVLSVFLTGVNEAARRTNEEMVTLKEVSNVLQTQNGKLALAIAERDKRYSDVENSFAWKVTTFLDKLRDRLRKTKDAPRISL